MNKRKVIYILVCITVILTIIFLAPMPQNKRISDIFVNLGIKAYKAKALKLALFNYNTALKFQKNNNWAYNCRGNVRYKQKEYLKANEDFDKAIAISETKGACYSDAYYNKGLSLQSSANTEEALNYYLKAISCNKNFKNAYYKISFILIEKGEYLEAVKYLNIYSSLDPEDPDGYFATAYAYDGLKKYSEAIKYYNKVLEKDKTRIDAYINLSRENYRIKDYKGAIESASRALEYNKESSYALTNRAMGYIGSGQYQKALNDLNKSLEYDSKYSRNDNGWTYYARGLVMKKMNDKIAANADFKKAQKIASSYYNSELLTLILNEMK